jgi:hypothetical protein
MKKSDEAVHSEMAINEQFERATRKSTSVTLIQDAIKGFQKFRRKKQMPDGLDEFGVEYVKDG